MAHSNDYTVSVVIPLYNESRGLPAFHKSLLHVLNDSNENAYEIIYCNDGSDDGTGELVAQWNAEDATVKLITFSRNFGKENALTAGIAQARGQSVITLDGDGQHPVELIPKFINEWRQGARVVVGIRTNHNGGTFSKRIGSRLFYFVFNKITGQKLIPGSTDFRLIDRTVQEAFLSLKETDRLTRGLIDWLGFSTVYIPFKSKVRYEDSPGYTHRMLIKLAMNSMVSLSPVPLYLFGYMGIFITSFALLAGISIITEQLLLDDPWHWNFTGTAMLSILLLFLIGVVLMSQGLLSLYISHIHNQSKKRPLYIIDYQNSAGIKKYANAR